MTHDDGGPAYPCPRRYQPLQDGTNNVFDSSAWETAQDGMTLLDRFA